MLERLLRRSERKEPRAAVFETVTRDAFRFLESEHGFRAPTSERRAHGEETVDYQRDDGLRVRAHLEDGGDYVGVEVARPLSGTVRVEIADPHVPWTERRAAELERVVGEYAAAVRARFEGEVRDA